MASVMRMVLALVLVAAVSVAATPCNIMPGTFFSSQPGVCSSKPCVDAQGEFPPFQVADGTPPCPSHSETTGCCPASDSYAPGQEAGAPPPEKQWGCGAGANCVADWQCVQELYSKVAGMQSQCKAQGNKVCCIANKAVYNAGEVKATGGKGYTEEAGSMCTFNNQGVLITGSCQSECKGSQVSQWGATPCKRYCCATASAPKEQEDILAGVSCPLFFLEMGQTADESALLQTGEQPLTAAQLAKCKENRAKFLAEKAAKAKAAEAAAVKPAAPTADAKKAAADDRKTVAKAKAGKKTGKAAKKAGKAGNIGKAAKGKAAKKSKLAVKNGKVGAGKKTAKGAKKSAAAKKGKVKAGKTGKAAKKAGKVTKKTGAKRAVKKTGKAAKKTGAKKAAKKTGKAAKKAGMVTKRATKKATKKTGAKKAAKRTRKAVKQTRKAAKRTRKAAKRTRKAVKRTRKTAKRTRKAAKRTRKAVKQTRKAAKRTNKSGKKTNKKAPAKSVALAKCTAKCTVIQTRCTKAPTGKKAICLQEAAACKKRCATPNKVAPALKRKAIAPKRKTAPKRKAAKRK